MHFRGSCRAKCIISSQTFKPNAITDVNALWNWLWNSCAKSKLQSNRECVTFPFAVTITPVGRQLIGKRPGNGKLPNYLDWKLLIVRVCWFVNSLDNNIVITDLMGEKLIGKTIWPQMNDLSSMQLIRVNITFRIGANQCVLFSNALRTVSRATQALKY